MKLSSLALLLLIAAQARADVVATAGKRFFGRVVSITPKTIVFLGECDALRRGEIDRGEVKSILFDPALCKEAPISLPTAGLQGKCEGTPITAYEVGFLGGGSVLAYDLAIANDKMHADLGQTGSLHGPASAIRFISTRLVCPSILASQEPHVPASVCLEPWHVAVNFSFAPVFNNHVFTRGFAVYVESDDLPSPTLAEERRQMVSKAFGSAIVIWTSALLRIRGSLESDLATWLTSISPSGGQFKLLIPPQAVPATCKDYGSVSVRWLTKNDAVFPVRRDYLAKAQVEGRTIALDARDFDFVWDLHTEKIPPSQTDLIKVLVHEFGHCLGMPHSGSGVKSMMAEVITNMADTPTDEDAKALSAILGRQIRGASVGDFDATFCSGLRPGEVPAARPIPTPANPQTR